MTRKPRKNTTNAQPTTPDIDSAKTFTDLLLNLGRNPTLPVPDRSPANANESELDELL
jgi:hypothetical protein